MLKICFIIVLCGFIQSICGRAFFDPSFLGKFDWDQFSGDYYEHINVLNGKDALQQRVYKFTNDKDKVQLEIETWVDGVLRETTEPEIIGPGEWNLNNKTCSDDHTKGNFALFATDYDSFAVFLLCQPDEMQMVFLFKDVNFDVETIEKAKATINDKYQSMSLTQERDEDAHGDDGNANIADDEHDECYYNETVHEEHNTDNDKVENKVN